MPHHSRSEIIEAQGCSISLCRVNGPEAVELFFNCQPPGNTVDTGQQTEAIYRAMLDVLEAAGGSFASVVSEMVFLRSVPEDLEPFRHARARILERNAIVSHRPAILEIGQTPLHEQHCLEVSIQAIVPTQGPLQVQNLDCADAHGLCVPIGGEIRVYAAALHGDGDGAYAQTLAMFDAAEKLLQQAGLEFGDVVRTWIHLREMDRDYDEFNRARRLFFGQRGVDPAPASTGIGAAPVSAEHDLCLSLYAVGAGAASERTVMTTPTLNEAPQYGSDFSRGMRIAESNKTLLHVSGTASLDEAGKTVHVGDLEAQADRMLLNVARLLEEQGASLDNVVSAITYLKRPEDAQRFRQKLRHGGFEGFPNVIVVAPVCRPELLCETEVIAVLPAQ